LNYRCISRWFREVEAGTELEADEEKPSNRPAAGPR